MAGPKRFATMTALEMSELPKARKDALFQEAVFDALRSSVEHGNTGAANKTLQLLPVITKKAEARAALIAYFEKWGLLVYMKSEGQFRYSKDKKGLSWTADYAAELNAHPWMNWIGTVPASEKDTDAGGTVYDADKEFRKVLDRLRKAIQDPDKVVIHAVLITKIQELIYEYGRTDAHVKEELRGRTLYDQSIKMTTMRASKLAKGLQR